jgi:hypothetical protein
MSFHKISLLRHKYLPYRATVELDDGGIIQSDKPHRYVDAVC